MARLVNNSLAKKISKNLKKYKKPAQSQMKSAVDMNELVIVNLSPLSWKWVDSQVLCDKVKSVR